MASKVEDITIEYVDEGVTTVKELDKVILTKGAWATIIFKYQDWDKRKEEWLSYEYENIGDTPAHMGFGRIIANEDILWEALSP